MRGNREEKQALDRQTAYLTFLPPMDEGFHTGYHTAPGIVSDHNRRPREWLESLARCLQTPGVDVSYSIPDVLSAEQQLRRLSRLTPERALAHPSMAAWRGVLALLLLWDTWPQDGAWPVLKLVRLSDGGTAFSASVTAALSPARAPDGLWAFTLRGEGIPARPVALLSRAMAVVPAADPGDLSPLLPPCVTWYDRAQRRFLDPCARLCERDAAFLAARLALLCRLNEQPSLRSPLYDAAAGLCGVLRPFLTDISRARGAWRDLLSRGDAQALDDLRARILAAHTLADTPAAVRAETLRPDEADPAANPFLRVVVNAAPPTAGDACVLYSLDGAAFARRSAFCLAEPARIRGEADALARLKRELSLLERYDAGWRERTSVTLRELAEASQDRPGLWPRLPGLLTVWADELDRRPEDAGFTLEVTYPLDGRPAALCALLREALGMEDAALVEAPFSDALLLLDGPPPFADDALHTACRVTLGTRTCYAVPPLSPRLCAFLMDAADADASAAPRLDLSGLRFLPAADGRSVEAQLCLRRRVQSSGKAAESAVTLRRTYTLGDALQTGKAIVLPAGEAPCVTVWPNVRLAPGLWKRYFLHIHQPRHLDAWALGTEGWTQGDLRHAPGREWRNTCVDRFPAFVALRRGALSLGALLNDAPRRLLRHEPAAAIAIDFGSISTTVMLRQDGRVQPASLPECLHRTLLSPAPDDGARLADEFLPDTVLLPGSAVEATYYSVMDMFTDVPETWRTVLCDGHIYYRLSLPSLLEKSASALYYDLKWSGEDYALRCLRLFLKQAMLQAALSARLWGSSSASWRVSMPNAMPPAKQEAYLEMMRGLAREVSAECGLPLTGGCPAVLYATENQADGLYFLSRSEVNAGSGYLNLDIGGSTADISLWLGGAAHAAIECSLLLGCREMLFESLCDWHSEDLERDLSSGSEALRQAASGVVSAFRREASTARGRLKCMFLLDDLLAAYAGDIREAMAAARSLGGITYFESLLLLHIGYLFYLSGELMQRAHADADLSPLLPQRMALCVAGNGGQLVKALTDEQLTRLCSLAMTRLAADHPLRVLLPVQSRHPKQEVARGLLARDDALQSAVHGGDRWNGTRPYGGPEREDLLSGYLPLFYRVFPQAAERLMPRAFEEADGVRLTATARMELDTIFANEKPCTPEDDMAMAVRCLSQLKRLWRL